MNRAHVWNSDAIWYLKPTANDTLYVEDTFYIENASENKVLRVIEDNVELVQNGAGELWEKGETNKEGCVCVSVYFYRFFRIVRSYDLLVQHQYYKVLKEK